MLVSLLQTLQAGARIEGVGGHPCVGVYGCVSLAVTVDGEINVVLFSPLC